MPYIMYIGDPAITDDYFNAFETKEQLLAKVKYLLEQKLQEPEDLVIFETTTATALQLSTEFVIRLSDAPKLPSQPPQPDPLPKSEPPSDLWKLPRVPKCQSSSSQQ